MAFSPTNEEGLEQPAVLVTWCIELLLTGITLRLFQGQAADISFSSRTFISSHPDYGSLGSISELVEGGNAESPRPEITILPPSDEAAVALMEAGDDGCAAAIWFAILSRDTGQPIATPELMFTGYVDQPHIEAGEGRSGVRFECITAAEYFHDRGEGYELNGPSHKLIRAGELGFDLVGKVGDPLYWGSATPGTAPAKAPSLGTSLWNNSGAGKLAKKTVLGRIFG